MRRVFGWIRRRRVDLLIAAILLVTSLVASAVTIFRAPQVSPIDEISHIDYVWRVMHGELPHRGDELTDFALNQWACRGQENVGDSLPACGTTDRAEFDIITENYNAWQPPLFFAVVGMMTRVGMMLTSFDAVVLMRLACAVIFAVGLVCLYAIMRRWGVPAAVAFGCCALLFGMSAFALTSSTVSTDAPFLLVGVGAAWVLKREARDEKHGWHIALLVGLLSALVKTIACAAVLVVAVVLGVTGLYRLLRHRADGWRCGFTALGAVVGVGIGTLTWNAYVSAHTPAGWQNPVLGVNTVVLESGELPFLHWLATGTSVFGWSGFWEPAQTVTYLGSFTQGIAALLLTAAPFMAVLVLSGPERKLGWVGLLGPFMVVMFVEVQEWLRENAYFATVFPRYGLSLVALTALCLAVALRNRSRTTQALTALGGTLIAVLSVLDAMGMGALSVS